METRSDVLYSDRWVTVDTVEAHRADGAPFRHRRVKVGPGRGAIVVCLVGDRVVMVRQPRPAPGLPVSLEFPRGGTVDDSAEEALRELAEETGVGSADIRTVTKLGHLHPDTGILGNEVTVWLVTADPRLLAAGPEWESCAVAHLVPLADAAADSTITCGMTLAALHLVGRFLRSQAVTSRVVPLRLVTGARTGLAPDPDSVDAMLAVVPDGPTVQQVREVFADALDWAGRAGIGVLNLVNEAGVERVVVAEAAEVVGRNRAAVIRLEV